MANGRTLNEHNYQVVAISVAAEEDNILKEFGCLSLQIENKYFSFEKRIIERTISHFWHAA